jgi:hypothetical protein
MAKLKARGREEIFRVGQVKTSDSEGVAEVHNFRALMSDGNLLGRMKLVYTPEEKAKNYGKGSHDYGWVVRGRARAGLSVEQLLKTYLEKGWALEEANPAYFTQRGNTIEGISSKPFISEEKAEKRKATLAKQRTKAEGERERKAREEDGPGYYVTNGYTGSGSIFRTRIADHPRPFPTYDKAEEFAVRRLQHLTVDFNFDYLLPVWVIESPSRQAAEQNEGYVWWVDGKFKGPPVDPCQASFGF